MCRTTGRYQEAHASTSAFAGAPSRRRPMSKTRSTTSIRRSTAPSKAPVINPATGQLRARLDAHALIPATYANGIIFPKGSACTAAQAISPQVTCSPFGSHINPNKNTNFGPRFGFAYNPDGRGLTSIRGGFGIFYDRLLNGIWEQNAFQDPPLLQTTTINNTSFDSPSGANAVSYGPNALTVTGTPTFHVPNYANYNVSVQTPAATHDDRRSCLCRQLGAPSAWRVRSESADSRRQSKQPKRRCQRDPPLPWATDTCTTGHRFYKQLQLTAGSRSTIAFARSDGGRRLHLVEGPHHQLKRSRYLGDQQLRLQDGLWSVFNQHAANP